MTQNEEWGDLVEQYVGERLGLARVPDETAEWHDLEAQETVDVLDEDGTVAYIVDGEPVEAKSARWYAPSSRQRGRWHIRRRNHEQLLEAGGHYALVVYDAATRDVADDVADVANAVVHFVILPASTVDVLVPSWHADGARGDYGQVAWSRVVDPDDGRVRRDGRLVADGGTIRQSSRDLSQRTSNDRARANEHREPSTGSAAMDVCHHVRDPVEDAVTPPLSGSTDLAVPTFRAAARLSSRVVGTPTNSPQNDQQPETQP